MRFACCALRPRALRGLPGVLAVEGSQFVRALPCSAWACIPVGSRVVGDADGSPFSGAGASRYCLISRFGFASRVLSRLP